VIVSVSKSPEFLNQVCVNWTIETLEVVSPTLILQLFSEVNTVPSHVFKIHQ
jgi:hypothetical protein